MGRLPLAVYALAWAVSALAQVSVQESATRAHLVEGKTSVSLGLRNSSSKPLDARIELQWLGPPNERHGFERRSLEVRPGDASIEIRMPLSDQYDPLLDRLQYDVFPGEKNYTAFAAVKGILNFVNIADYAFALSVVTADLPRPGKPFEIRVLTSHPATGQPVAGVNVKSEHSAAISDRNGVALLQVQAEPDEDQPEFEISARLGDFRQSGETTQLVLRKGDVRIYTDKPLHQPGQTMHVRILARSGDGSARGDAGYEIRILDENGDLAHAATVTTSRFGVAWTDWEIPSNAKSGEYKIEISSEESDDRFSRRVNVRRYELPSFRVTAKPDRSYYLLHQKAVIEIGADYLFGKPVTSGKVRVTEDDDDSALLEGSLDDAGRFRGTIETGEEIAPDARFIDRHFNAFLTDASTNRTEQCKFDLRVSRDPLHVYVAKAQYAGAGRRLYVTTYSPDGAPVLSSVEIVSGTNVLGTGRTNKLGLTRIDIHEGEEDKLEVRAVTKDGRRAREEARFYGFRSSLSLETGRSLYRSGEAVQCRIGSARKDLSVLLLAWNESGQTVFSRNVQLRNGYAQVEIPYTKRFGRKLSLGVASAADRSTASRVVLFPGPGDLVVRALPAKATYRPGETARIQFQASAETALGVAIVDQSVRERAATDRAFGRRWFEFESEQQPSLAGITERDLATLDPAKIDDDLQLAGELLLQEPSLINSVNDLAEELRTQFAKAGRKALEQVRIALDDHYLRTLQYPRDESALFTTVYSAYLGIQDPWMRPYHARFETEGPEDVVRFISAGPDKQLGTADDFCALEVRRKWFDKFEALIGNRLRAFSDYPATREEFIRALEEAGIRFEALRDPWGNALRIDIAHVRNRREIRILSAGPDRAFGTEDDFTVASFQGAYFAVVSANIGRALSAAQPFPQTTVQFRAALQAAGIDFDSLRDPWGRAYYLAFRTEQAFTDRVRLYSYAEYNGVREDRKLITPVKRTVSIVEISSVGDDGVKGTYDDFEVASFSRVLDNIEPQSEEVERLTPPLPSIGGTGTIAGIVTDVSGAVIPGAQVTLNGLYITRTDANGWYFFRGMPPGLYRLKFESSGFQVSVIDRAPVKPDHLTRADTVLQVGSVSEMITVQAEMPLLNTSMASMVAVVSGVAAATALSTPRVREYFPETLYWQPELVTDAAGHASIDVKLADSITTWHVAVIGSTRDGRITEASADIQAFQPFLVDLDVPPVLTTGDEIELPVPVRNYLERSQKVVVSVVAPKSLSLLKAVRQPNPIPPSFSGNAVLTLRADGATSAAWLRVTAVSGQASDAIEKPVAIHPDGERKEITVNGVAEDGRLLRVNVPSNAVPGSMQAEVKFYPSLLARVLESMETMLHRPYGCGEQTISSTYPNLLFLKALKDAGIKEARLEARAMKNLRAGYQRLLGYQAEDGGFTYWGRGDADIALTAYAISFLRDAKEFIEVDEDRTEKAQDWLGRQEAKEGGAHALQVRALAQAGPKYAVDLDRVLGKMARQAAEFEHPYAIAAFVLAAIDAAKPELARSGVERLSAMAQDEQGAAYWNLKANTPFYSWGRAGQVETTALVVSALAKWRKAGNVDAAIGTLIDRGALFLLKNTDASGAWSTTQSTVRALTALLDTWATDVSKPFNVAVSVNGASAGQVAIPAERTLRGPLTLDISRLVRPGITNEVSVAGTDSHAVQAQWNTTWYEPWGNARAANVLALETRYSSVAASINQPVTCDVLVSRPSFQGYGMMIAEIGLPPGAEVDLGTLASILDDPKSGVDSFEVAPDHVTFYVWPRVADSKFRFVFRPRFAMQARAAQSVLYDYYNPDERVVLSPKMFTVEQ